MTVASLWALASAHFVLRYPLRQASPAGSQRMRFGSNPAAKSFASCKTYQ